MLFTSEVEDTYYISPRNICQHRWCSGIMQDSHSCDPGSIPGRCNYFCTVWRNQPVEHRGSNMRWWKVHRRWEKGREKGEEYIECIRWGREGWRWGRKVVQEERSGVRNEAERRGRKGKRGRWKGRRLGGRERRREGRKEWWREKGRIGCKQGRLRGREEDFPSQST